MDCAEGRSPTCAPPSLEAALQGSDPIVSVADNGLGENRVRLTLQKPRNFHNNGSYTIAQAFRV